jgi:hypothetical protein
MTNIYGGILTVGIEVDQGFDTPTGNPFNLVPSDMSIRGDHVVIKTPSKLDIPFS